MTDNKFAQLGLHADLVAVLTKLGLTEPRDIQTQAIPLALQGKDIIGASATGSGKTLAFGAGIIEQIQPGNGIQALVMTPTRELAEQVAASLDKFSRHKKVEVCAVYGGISIEPQIRYLKHADIVVGTPGRLLDHLERRTIKLDKVKWLVLDEADRMLDMGFIDDVTDIIKHCPSDRQTFLFSATMSPDIRVLSEKYMKKPAMINTVVYVDPSKLKQVFYDCPKDIKFSLLVHLLKEDHAGLIMVFCNTQRTTDFVANHLQENGIHATAIHGGLTQNKRTRVMEDFKDKRVAILVCTDVAARGLDIQGVSHVYNYDVPMSSKEYIHRIGRTARAGKDGIAITLVTQRDYDNFRSVLRNEELTIEQLTVPAVPPIRVSFQSGRSESRGGFGGRSRFSGGRGRSSSGGRRFGGRDEARERRGMGRGPSSQFGARRGSSFGSSRRPSFGGRERRY